MKIFYTSEREIWRAWLAEHFETESEVWFVFPMKESGDKALSYNDAVEEALCFGWIDSTIKHIDPTHRAQRFTPRKKGSPYSRPNIERLIWLDERGMIHPSVREAVLPIIRAPYVFPSDILNAIKSDMVAWKNYEKLSEPYKRIRIAYIDAARKRPDEFQKRLESFIKKTREGLRNVSVVVRKGKKKIYEDFGEMLFTHFGISGPLVLSASAFCGKLKDYKDLIFSIDLKPALTAEQVDDRLLRIFDANKNKQFRNCLNGLLPNKLIPVAIRLSGIDPFKQVNLISREERARFVYLLKHLDIHIRGFRGFNESIVTGGGIKVKEINPKTMESKLVKNLYFAGEVIDVDALTGGFNLQIAWSTGWLAAKNMLEVIENEL